MSVLKCLNDGPHGPHTIDKGPWGVVKCEGIDPPDDPTGWPDGEDERHWNDPGSVTWDTVVAALAGTGIDMSDRGDGLMSVTIADGQITVVRARRSSPSNRPVIMRDEVAVETKTIRIGPKS